MKLGSRGLVCDPQRDLSCRGLWQFRVTKQDYSLVRVLRKATSPLALMSCLPVEVLVVRTARAGVLEFLVEHDGRMGSARTNNEEDAIRRIAIKPKPGKKPGRSLVGRRRCSMD